MNMVLSRSQLPDDAGIGIEYCLPLGAKRIDFLITGKSADSSNALVIVELKQWTDATAVEGTDGTVSTALGGGQRLVTHPSYQALSYAQTLEDFNESVARMQLEIAPCAYLHNYVPDDPEPLLSAQYREYVDLAPLFMATDIQRLREFIDRYVHRGDQGATLLEIEQGRIRPTKSLQDALSSMLEGNREFTLLDEQKVVFDLVRSKIRRSTETGEKHVVIVEGGPGTGKSVVAINLLVDTINSDLMAAYVSKNAAPRNVYGKLLAGNKRSGIRISSLFQGSGQFIDAQEREFDVLVVDEAHRLNEKSGMYRNLGDNQILEAIRASGVTVFFIDEAQRVTVHDIGTVSAIEQLATESGATVTRAALESQFRCAGSDAYLEWVASLLGMAGSTAGLSVDFEYDFRVFDSPNEMHEAIERADSESGRSRVVAGYCWAWPKDSKNNPDQPDIVIGEHGYAKSWNLGSTSTWAIDAGSIHQVGCIHTCQGLEFDYVGVILGPDIRYEDGQIVTDASKHPSQDSALRGLRKLPQDHADALADEIIKNTYYVLMTRGMRGCYIYCVDPGLQRYFKDRLGEIEMQPLLAADDSARYE